MKKLFIIIAVLLLPCWAGATNYFVNQAGSGDDSGDSLGNAMPIVDYNSGNLNALVDPGDTVYFCDAITTGIVAQEAGTSGNTITLNGKCSDQSGVDATLSGMAVGITVNLSYIDIRDITVQNTTGNGIHIAPSGASIQNIYIYDVTVDNAGGTYGIYFGSPSGQEGYAVQNVGLYDSEVKNCDDAGVAFASFGELSVIEVLRNTIHDNNDDDTDDYQNLTFSSRKQLFDDAGWSQHLATNIYYRTPTIAPNTSYSRVLQNETSFRELTLEGGTCTADTDDGEWCESGGDLYINIGGDPTNIEIIYIIGKTHNGTVANNKIYNGSYDTNLYFDDGAQNFTVKYNEVYGCQRIGGANGGYGIHLKTTKDITLLYNVVYDNEFHGLTLTDQPQTTLVYGNVFEDNDKDNIRLAGQGTMAVTIQNNIISNASEYGIKDPYTAYTETLSYNLYYNNTSGNLSGATSAGNDVTADPKYKNAAGDDYTLLPSSPAIGKGFNLGASYDDALWPGSTWPDGVVTKDQDLYTPGWEMGAFVFPTMQGPGVGLIQ